MGKKRNTCNFFVLCEDILLRKKFAEMFSAVDNGYNGTAELFTAPSDLLSMVQQHIEYDAGEIYIFIDLHAQTFVATTVIEELHTILSSSAHTIIGIAQAMYPEMLRQGKLVGMAQLITKPMAYELVEKMLRIAGGNTAQLDKIAQENSSPTIL